MSAYIAVVGPGEASPEQAEAAEAVGGGMTVGILPGHEREAANEFVDVALATGLGEARNALVVRAADALIAVGGGYGTLSEIALALKAGKRVVGLGSWEIEGVEQADSAERAADLLLS